MPGGEDKGDSGWPPPHGTGGEGADRPTSVLTSRAGAVGAMVHVVGTAGRRARSGRV